MSLTNTNTNNYDDFIIEIDNYYFRILNQDMLNGRLIINIYSSKDKNELIQKNIDLNEVNKFSVYLSKSEIGCFRLCLLENLGPFEKGDEDYILQTFIHIKLQQFIHECLNKLNELNKKPLMCFCTKGKNMRIDYINDNEWNNIFEHINETDRKIKEDPFKNYSNNKCGEDNLKLFSKVNEDLDKFSIELEKIYNFSNNKSISNIIINEKDNVYNLKFYKVELKLKEQNKYVKYQDNIILYYCNAKITKFLHYNLGPIYINLPVFLTTEEGDKITKFGTYEKYILAGNYICKIFDYITQCSNDLRGVCYNGYLLIGNRYDNIFPLKEINSTINKLWKDELSDENMKKIIDEERVERELKKQASLLASAIPASVTTRVISPTNKIKQLKILIDNHFAKINNLILF